MFIGHYGPAFAGKAIVKRVPLWLCSSPCNGSMSCGRRWVMLNVEKLRIVKGFTEGSALDLYYMPYTHGLIGAVALSAVLGALAMLFYRERRAAVWVVIAGRGVLALAARPRGPRPRPAAAG